MAGPVANVRNVIVIEGVDNASAAIDKAKKSLGGLEASARKTGKEVKAAGDHTKDAFSHGLPGLEGKHDSFNRLASAVGGAGGALAEATHGVALLDAGLRLIPGPVGAAVAGVTALGAAAFLVGRHFAEAKAKIDLLGDAHTEQLADKLNIDLDAAVKLTQALGDLGGKGLRPTDALLEVVTKRAESLGKDGAEAVVSFVHALEQGPAALKKFEQEYGKLAGLIADTSKLAASIGLNPEALGLAKAQTAEGQRQLDAAQGLQRIQLLQVELAKREAEEAHAVNTAEEYRGKLKGDLAILDQKAAAQRIAATRDQIAAETQNLAVIQREVEAHQRLADAQAALAARADVLDAQASATANKRERSMLASGAAVVRQLAATRALNEFDRLHGKTLDAKLLTERQILQAKVYQANASALALREQARAEARQRAEAARSSAQAAKQAELDARLRTLRAQADRDGIQNEKERLALIDLEHQKSIQATDSIKSSKARAAARMAADEEYASAKAKLERDLATETIKVNDDLQKTLEAAAKKSADLQQAAADAVVATERARSASLADVLRARGLEERAVEVERRQAHADYSQALIAIDRDRLAALAEVAQGSEDAAAVEARADAERVRAKLELEAVERKLAAAAKERARAARADAVASLEGPANALKALGSLGSINAGGLGEGLSATIKGVQDLDAAMSASEQRASDYAGAIGGAVTGVGDAIVDSSTRSALVQIEKDKQRRLSTAKTEEERARITQEAEDAKARAVEAAERRKAGIAAVVEGAKAIASLAEYDYVAAAGHGAAAIAFGAIAGGAGGSTSQSAVPSAGSSGGFNSPSGSGSGFGNTGSGTVTIINNFNQPLATEQSIGKAVHSSLRSLKGTGTDRGRGV